MPELKDLQQQAISSDRLYMLLLRTRSQQGKFPTAAPGQCPIPAIVPLTGLLAGVPALSAQSELKSSCLLHHTSVTIRLLFPGILPAKAPIPNQSHLATAAALTMEWLDSRSVSGQRVVRVGGMRLVGVVQISPQADDKKGAAFPQKMPPVLRGKRTKDEGCRLFLRSSSSRGTSVDRVDMAIAFTCVWQMWGIKL